MQNLLLNPDNSHTIMHFILIYIFIQIPHSITHILNHTHTHTHTNTHTHTLRHIDLTELERKISVRKSKQELVDRHILLQETPGVEYTPDYSQHSGDYFTPPPL